MAQAAVAGPIQDDVAPSDSNSLAVSRHSASTSATINSLFGPDGAARLGGTVAAGAAANGPGARGPSGPAPGQTHRTGLMATLQRRDAENSKPEHGNDDGGAGNLIMGAMLGGPIAEIAHVMHAQEAGEEMKGKSVSRAGVMTEGLDGKPRLDGVAAAVEAPKAAPRPHEDRESTFRFGPARRR